MLETKTETREDYIAHGVSTCAGCGLELAVRVVLRALGKNTVMVNPPGCAALFAGFGNETSMRIPGFQGNLENTAAYAAGIRAGFEVQGRDDITVLGFAGDGATVDIGLQALSGAMERGDKILYICYDNEGYMNTGIQASSSTLQGAWTKTTPAGKTVPRKNMLEIVAAHRIPYAASASIGYVDDLRKKVEKAKACGGPSYIHVHSPCPQGWGCEQDKTIAVARLAVLSRVWPLYEILDGVNYRLTYPVAKPKKVEEYLQMQARFKDMSPAMIDVVQNAVDKEYEVLQRMLNG